METKSRAQFKFQMERKEVLMTTARLPPLQSNREVMQGGAFVQNNIFYVVLHQDFFVV